MKLNWFEPERFESGAVVQRALTPFGRVLIEYNATQKLYEITEHPVPGALNWHASTLEAAVEQAESAFEEALNACRAEQAAEGWKEATIAWAVAASVHREWGKKKDALFTTRQADYVRHEEDARTKYKELVNET